MTQDIANKIRAERKARGWSQGELVKKLNLMGANTYVQQISRFEKGDTRITTDWAERFAAVFGMSTAEFIDDSASAAGVVNLKVKGYVQAGAWVDALELPDDDQEDVPVYVGDMPGTSRMFLLKVRGDSMNMANMPEGTLLVCMQLYDFMEYRDIKNRDYVICHRTDSMGHYEATVKELEIRPDGSHWLWPRSDNPEHQAPIKVPAATDWNDGAGEVSIHAVVVGHNFLGL